MNFFCEKPQDKPLYGTDNDPGPRMYEVTFRILETLDERLYYFTFYHWLSSGFGLNDNILKKVYLENAKKILEK